MNQTNRNAEIESGWHPAWEDNVYSQGRHLNRYPYDAVVSFIYSNFGHVTDRSKVTILELGCGAGNNLWFAAREGFTVAGIDGSTSAIEYARQRFVQENLTGDLRIGDFTSLPWPDATFDMVLDRGALTCVRRGIIDSALSESRRVLKPGGRIYSIIYSEKHPDRVYGRHLGDNSYDNFTDGYFLGLGTVYFATREEIIKLYGSHFKVTSIIHLQEEELMATPQITDAHWKIEAVKE